MITNSMRQPKSSEPQKEYLPIIVYCVVYDYSEYNDPTIHTIHEHCLNNNIIFKTRRYSSQKFSTDRNYISSLPAFHIYMNKAYQETFYPTTRPIQHIDECIQKYNHIQDMKKQRREKWRKRIEAIQTLFKNLFRGKKSRLERQQEIEAAMKAEKSRKIDSRTMAPVIHNDSFVHRSVLRE